MMKRFGLIGMACILLILCVLFAAPANAESVDSITMKVELDPSLELTGDGEITYMVFTVANAADTSYTLHNATLACKNLGISNALDVSIEVPAHGTKEIVLKNVPISDSLLDTQLIFVLSWQEVTYAPEDIANNVPIYAERSLSSEVTVPRFVEPVIGVSVASDLPLAKLGSVVTATYTLTNDTKFDMTSLSLYDVGTLNALIPLEKTSLLAGETATVTYTFEMGETEVELQPKVLYNVRGKLIETVAEIPVSVACAIISLDFSVETYPATQDGTLFSITVFNSGTHDMTDISVRDEIQTEVAKPFNLAPQQTKTLSYLVSTAISATQSRIVTFTVTATDCFYDTYTFADANVYEVLPYISSDQVNISLSATLTNTYTNENGVLCGTVSFELRNYSAVALSNASLRETLVYTATPLISFDLLGYGITAYSQEFAVSDLSALSFVLLAYDAAGNEYRSENITIDLSKLSAATNTADEELLVSSDVIGTNIDMQKYFKLAYRTLLIVAICVGVCFVIIYALYSAEKRERANLPLEDSGLTDEAFGLTVPAKTDSDVFQNSRMEHIPASQQASQFGYVAPTKLRYIEQAATAKSTFTDIPNVTSPNEESVSDVKIYHRGGKEKVVKRPTELPVQHADFLDNNGETRRFSAVSVQDKADKRKTMRVRQIPATEKTALGYPKAVPTESQMHRRTLQHTVTVYRMNG